MALGIVHFGILDGPVIITSQFLDPNLPVIQLPQQPINIIIDTPDLVFRSGPILYLLHFLNNFRTDLFSPFLALIKIIDLTDMTKAFRSLVVFLVYEAAFHHPPAI